jgi:hypothetical protein
MKKIIIISLIFFNACSIIPKHKNGYVVTKTNQRIELTGGNIFINEKEIHFLDNTADFTLYKKEIKEIYLNYEE